MSTLRTFALLGVWCVGVVLCCVGLWMLHPGLLVVFAGVAIASLAASAGS